MIKVFECLGVQTFEKDGKKGTNIYYSEPFDDSEKIAPVLSAITCSPTRILQFQSRERDSRLCIHQALTSKTNVTYRYLRSSTQFRSINSVNYLFGILHNNMVAGLRFGSSPKKEI